MKAGFLAGSTRFAAAVLGRQSNWTSGGRAMGAQLLLDEASDDDLDRVLR